MTPGKRPVAGLTLMELLITMTLMGLLAAAVASAFVAGLDARRQQNQQRTEREELETLEQRIQSLLQGAKLSDDTQDRTTYFIGDDVGDTLEPLAANPTQQGGQAPTLDSDRSREEGVDPEELGCTRLTFTTLADDIPFRARTDTADFETQQNQHGPVGGIAEVTLATTPVGDAGERTGLFERLQRPSDGDPGQGGQERLLSGRIAQIGFQFWDGTGWVSVWDTVNGVQRRLPAAVLVRYTVEGEAGGVIHERVVPIPGSDITAQNPLATGTTAAAPTGSGT